MFELARSEHVDARFTRVSSPFSGVRPVPEVWNCVIRPQELLHLLIILESDPNPFKRWLALVNKFEYAFVFFEAGYLH